MTFFIDISRPRCKFFYFKSNHMVQVGWQYVAVGIIFHSLGKYSQLIEDKKISWVEK